MGEEKITITIDGEGRVHLETKGIKGPLCMNEAMALLDRVAVPVHVNKTDEFFAGAKTGVRSSVKARRGSG